MFFSLQMFLLPPSLPPLRSHHHRLDVLVFYSGQFQRCFGGNGQLHCHSGHSQFLWPLSRCPAAKYHPQSKRRANQNKFVHVSLVLGGFLHFGLDFWIFMAYLSSRFSIHILTYQSIDKNYMSRVSCQKGPTRHAYAWQIGPFWQDTIDVSPCPYLD